MWVAVLDTIYPKGFNPDSMKFLSLIHIQMCIRDRFETLSAETKDMVNKNQWIFNAANILNSAAEDGHERAANSVFASAQLAWKEYLSMDLTARNDWSSTRCV